MKIGKIKARYVAFPPQWDKYTVGFTIDAKDYMTGGEHTLVHPLGLHIEPGFWIKTEDVREPNMREWVVIGQRRLWGEVKIRLYYLKRVVTG